MGMKRLFQVVSKYKTYYDTKLCENFIMIDDKPTKFKMPYRATTGAAGYDIFNNTGKDIILKPNEVSDTIPTFIKVHMHDDEVFEIYPRSGHGFKYQIRLANTIGVVDSDYCDNPKNEGEIFFKLQNLGKETVTIKHGEACIQGIFKKYYITDDDAETVGGKRVGGLGSTNN